MDQHITTPITEEVTKKLHSGDYVYISMPLPCLILVKKQ